MAEFQGKQVEQTFRSMDLNINKRIEQEGWLPPTKRASAAKIN